MKRKFQIHRGSLTDYIKTLNAMVDPTPKVAKPINSPPTALIKPQPKIIPPLEQPDIVKDSEQSSRIEFVNVKDLVKGIEKPKKEEKNSKKLENVEKNQNSHDKNTPVNVQDDVTLSAESDQVDCNDLPESDQIIADASSQENLALDHKTNGVNNSEENTNESGSLNGNSTSVPPKPMPRSSISEAGGGEESYSNVNVVNGVPRPIARPRTTAQTNPSGYKVFKSGKNVLILCFRMYIEINFYFLFFLSFYFYLCVLCF